MAQDNSPEAFMALALEEARRGLGRTHPNPPVGAVVVKDGVVVGRGHHRKAGMPHAEVEAIRDAGERARGADIYVTLEPCNHFGRTPPCTEAILNAGLRRVFFGSVDPNPRVSGHGAERLQAAGLSVRGGVLQPQADDLIRYFVKFITTGRPFVVSKVASTLDGKLATRTGDSKWVSSSESRRLVHLWRDELDAVLVGANTLRTDDPALTTRLDVPGMDGREPRTPLRVALAGRGVVPPASMLFDPAPGPVLLAVPADRASEFELLRARGVDVLALPSNSGRIELGALLDALGKRGVTSLLVEGGAAVHAAFLRESLVDELRLFLAPRIAGSDGLSWIGPLGVSEMQHAWRIHDAAVRPSGPDWLVVGRPVAP